MPVGESMGRKIAVMQPYLFPYAGYYRLMAVSDIFVIYDDVQFPRRGRVHRCEMPGPGSERSWLTLPLRPQPRETLISDLAFADHARASFDARLTAYPWLSHGDSLIAGLVRDHLFGPLDGVADFLEDGLRLVAGALELPARIVRSSTFDLPAHLRGQDRIMAIVQALGGDTYINAPGGRMLYDDEVFRGAGVGLKFLPDYAGRYRYILPALMGGDLIGLRQDIMATCGDF